MRHVEAPFSRLRRPWLGRLRYALQSRVGRAGALRDAIAGRTVLVTGASAGIGRALSKQLAAAGATLLLVARDGDALESLVAEILAAGGEAHAFACDLSNPNDASETVCRVLAAHEGVDVLVNNAGQSIRRTVAESFDRPGDFERLAHLNYFGALRLILGFAPGMVARNGGHIVNVSTIGVQTGAPRFSGYVSSKAALDAFSRSAALELAPTGVLFTSAYLGLVRTRMSRATEVYDRFPAASVERAADRIAGMIVYRPMRFSTAIGFAMGCIHAVSPRFESWLFRVWHDRFHHWMAGRQRRSVQPDIESTNPKE